MDFLFENKSSLLFLLGIVMLIVILMRRWSRYFKRQKSAKRAARPLAMREPNAEQPLMDAPPELLRWQVEMHETARQLKGELDTKIAILQRLTIDAQRQAERLESIVQHAEHLEPEVVRSET
jgi:hypothetical protein